MSSQGVHVPERLDPRFIATFADAAVEDYPYLGCRGAGLAALAAIGSPTRAGFVIRTDAYARMIAENGLRSILAVLTKQLDPVGADVEVHAQAIRQAILQQPIPVAVAKAIRSAYAQLCARAGRELAVAVCASETANDPLHASFAHHGDTYLWTVGGDAVIDRVKSCWASLFSKRAITYRAKHKLQQPNAMMAVVVQAMVDATAAGLMALDPSKGNHAKIPVASTVRVGEAVSA